MSVLSNDIATGSNDATLLSKKMQVCLQSNISFLLSKCQNHVDDCANSCGLLKKVGTLQWKNYGKSLKQNWHKMVGNEWLVTCLDLVSLETDDKIC